MKKLLFLFIILISLCVPCYGQDQIVNARNTNVQITNPQAQGGGAGSVAWNSINTAYVLSPLGADYGFCMSVVNNNPTTAHTFTVTAFQTGDNGAQDYTHFSGRYAALAIVGTPSPVQPSTTNTFFIRSNGAAKIAFVFSGSTTQAGSPDTVDIYAVQTTASGCGTVNPQTGQQYTLATPNSGTSATTPIQAISDGISQSYASAVTVTNPGNSGLVIAVIGNNQAKNIYYDRVTITSSVTATIILSAVNSIGTTCSGPGSFGNIKLGVSNTSIATVQTTCTVNPGAGILGQFFSFPLVANTPVTFDLRGLICPANSTCGIEALNNTSIVGTINSTIFWYEK